MLSLTNVGGPRGGDPAVALDVAARENVGEREPRRDVVLGAPRAREHVPAILIALALQRRAATQDLRAGARLAL
eukprot:3121720-Lingulodinium_polyedra.AAC.1